jgi:hypothetical protein
MISYGLANLEIGRMTKKGIDECTLIKGLGAAALGVGSGQARSSIQKGDGRHSSSWVEVSN